MKTKHKTKKKTYKKISIKLFLLVASMLIILPLSKIGFQKLWEFTSTKTSNFFCIKTINIDFKDIYSSNLKHKLDFYIKNSLKNKPLFLFNFQNFYENLKEKFHFIKDIQWDRQRLNEGNLQVWGATPKYLVNNLFVLCDNKKLLPKTFFEDFFMIETKQVQIDDQYCQNESLVQEAYDFFEKIPEYVFKKYLIHHKNSSETLLQTKQNEKTKIDVITNTKTLFTEKDQTNVERIIKNLKEKKIFPSRKRGSVTLDFRFKNRIVAKVFDDTNGRMGK
jgi:hypothetical protein